MDDKEFITRALCHKHNMDPDKLVDPSGLGLPPTCPMWKLWESSAVGDVNREAEIAYRHAEGERQKAFLAGWLAHAAHVARQPQEESGHEEE